MALFQLSKYSYATNDTSIETIIALVALVFLLLGFYLNSTKIKKTQEFIEINHQKIKDLGISNREYEVLVEISKGSSNKEIGDALNLSESTIKTHVSNLLVKLDAKRRTQAIRKAKNLKIIAL